MSKHFLTLTLLIAALLPMHRLSATGTALTEPGYFSKAVLGRAARSLPGKLAITGFIASGITLVGHLWLNTKITTQTKKILNLTKKQSDNFDSPHFFAEISAQLAKAQKRLETLSAIHRVIKKAGPLALTASLVCAVLAIMTARKQERTNYIERELAGPTSAGTKPAPELAPAAGNPDSLASASTEDIEGSGDAKVDAAVDQAIKSFLDSAPNNLVQSFDAELQSFIRNRIKRDLKKYQGAAWKSELERITAQKTYIAQHIERVKDLLSLSAAERKVYYEKMLTLEAADMRGARLRTETEKLIAFLSSTLQAPDEIEAFFSHLVDDLPCMDYDNRYHHALASTPTDLCNSKTLREQLLTRFAKLFALEQSAAEELLTQVRHTLNGDYSETSFQKLSQSSLGAQLRQCAQAALATYTAQNEILKEKYPFNLANLHEEMDKLNAEIAAIPFLPATPEIAELDKKSLESIDAYLATEKGSRCVGYLADSTGCLNDSNRPIAAMLSRILASTTGSLNESSIGEILSNVSKVKAAAACFRRDEAIQLAQKALGLFAEIESIKATGTPLEKEKAERISALEERISQIDRELIDLCIVY